MDSKQFSELPIVCPVCRTDMVMTDGQAECRSCGRVFPINAHGFLELIEKRTTYYLDPVSDDYADDQEASADRLYREYLKPYLQAEDTTRVLDVGCGIGATVARILADGWEALGLDLPSLSRYWERLGRDPASFYCGDGAALPFASGYFDLVMSLGVIEHIGTVSGHSTLTDEYQKRRQEFADELLRVTRQGGRLLIACPNKSFPIDIQHGPSDGVSTSPVMKLRDLIFVKTGLNLHRTFGAYHLLSYGEVRDLFCGQAAARGFRPLPLSGYFGFGRFGSGPLRLVRRLAQVYLDNLPAALLATPLNPYMLVEIRK